VWAVSFLFDLQLSSCITSNGIMTTTAEVTSQEEASLLLQNDAPRIALESGIDLKEHEACTVFLHEKGWALGFVKKDVRYERATFTGKIRLFCTQKGILAKEYISATFQNRVWSRIRE
jgi:hypothetical protein